LVCVHLHLFSSLLVFSFESLLFSFVCYMHLNIILSYKLLQKCQVSVQAFLSYISFKFFLHFIDYISLCFHPTSVITTPCHLANYNLVPSNPPSQTDLSNSLTTFNKNLTEHSSSHSINSLHFQPQTQSNNHYFPFPLPANTLPPHCLSSLLEHYNPNPNTHHRYCHLRLITSALTFFYLQHLNSIYIPNTVIHSSTAQPNTIYLHHLNSSS